jgi:hypothetical protein
MTLDSPLDRIKSKNLTSGSTVERRSEQPPRLSAFLFWSTCFVLSRLKKNDSMRCFFPDEGPLLHRWRTQSSLFPTREKAAELNMKPGYAVIFTGSAKQLAQASNDFSIAILLAIVFI